MSIQQRSRIGGIGQPLNEKLMVADINEIVTELNNLPDPLTPNPTEQYVPLNYGGEFADSPIGIITPPGGYLGWAGLRTKVSTTIVPPSGSNQSNIAPYLEDYGLSILNTSFTGKQTVIGDYNGITNLTIDDTVGLSPRIRAKVSNVNILELNTNQSIYTFGNASVNTSTIQVQAIGGLAIYQAGSEAIIGCGMSSPLNGVFRASGVQGLITIGTTPSTSLGVYLPTRAVQIGSGFYDYLSSFNANTPDRFIKVRDESGVLYFIPVYVNISEPPPGGGGSEGGSEGGFFGGSE